MAQGVPQLAMKIRAFHEASDGIDGSPRIYRELKDDGEQVSRKRVARIMSEHGASREHPKRSQRTTDSSHQMPVAEDIVARNFQPR